MTELLTSAQMRAIEAAAIASGEVTGLELMERAGRGVVDAVFAEWPELAAGSHRAVVLCGPGGNGGDGFVVARLLRERGWEVEVFRYGTPEKMPPDARVNYERWLGMGEVRALTFPGVTPEEVDQFTEAAYGLSGTALVVDALFGIGLSRPIDGLSPLFGYNDLEVGIGDRLTPARHVSVDLPSGMFSDDPEPPGHLSWFLADLTVTFHRMKPAHVHRWTERSCGHVVVCDIGLECWHASGQVSQ